MKLHAVDLDLSAIADDLNGTRAGCTPAHARDLFDQLERKLGTFHPPGEEGGPHGDVVRAVPGAPEPPD